MNTLIDYFNLASGTGSIRSTAHATAAQGKPAASWLLQYVSLVLGVFVQPQFLAYQTSGSWASLGAGSVVFAAVVGIIVLPAAYKNAWDPAKPIPVQLCAIFAAGMGWESLVATGTKAAGL